MYNTVYRAYIYIYKCSIHLPFLVSMFSKRDFKFPIQLRLYHVCVEKKYAIIIPTVKRIQFFHAFKRIKYTICRSLDFSFVVFFFVIQRYIHVKQCIQEYTKIYKHVGEKIQSITITVNKFPYHKFLSQPSKKIFLYCTYRS